MPSSPSAARNPAVGTLDHVPNRLFEHDFERLAARVAAGQVDRAGHGGAEPSRAACRGRASRSEFVGRERRPLRETIRIRSLLTVLRLDPPRRERLPSRASQELRGPFQGARTLRPSNRSITTRMRARAGDPPARCLRKFSPVDAPTRSFGATSSRSKSTRSSCRARPRARSPRRWRSGLKKTPVELAVAYDGTCVTDAASNARHGRARPSRWPPEMPQAGILIARPGIGFPGAGAPRALRIPARLAVTDDPRLASVGGTGMLALVVSPGSSGRRSRSGR